MTPYRRLWMRNRLAAVAFFALVVAAVAGVVQLAGRATLGRPSYMLPLAIVSVAVLLAGLARWRWLHNLGDTMLGQERRARLDERGVRI